MAGAQKPRSAASMPTSQRKANAPGVKKAKKPTGTKTVVARRTRRQKVLSGELLPSLLDLEADGHGVLTTNLPIKPQKCAPKVWQEFKAIVRRRDVAYLRLHHGMSFAEIANYLDMDEVQARRDWQGRLKTVLEGDMNELRALEVQRMDDWLSMLEPNIRREVEASFLNPRNADYKALDRAIKIQSQRIKLLGLERPPEITAQEDLHHSLTQVNITLDMRANAAEYISGVLAGGSADPSLIIDTLQQLTQGAPSTSRLEGEALEEFLAIANSEVEILDVEEIHAEANRVLTIEDSQQEEEDE